MALEAKTSRLPDGTEIPGPDGTTLVAEVFLDGAEPLDTKHAPLSAFYHRYPQLDQARTPEVDEPLLGPLAVGFVGDHGVDVVDTGFDLFVLGDERVDVLLG